MAGADGLPPASLEARWDDAIPWRARVRVQGAGWARADLTDLRRRAESQRPRGSSSPMLWAVQASAAAWYSLALRWVPRAGS
jgi:hypothetical protein